MVRFFVVMHGLLHCKKCALNLNMFKSVQKSIVFLLISFDTCLSCLRVKKLDKKCVSESV